MIKKKFKVIYDGQLDEDVDDLIRNTLEGIGAKWYAQGYNFTTNERDICFDLEIILNG